MAPPLLLYSLAEFRELIFACLDVARPNAVVEVGSEAGLFTRELVGWIAHRGGTFVSIDPEPSADTVALTETAQHLRLVRAKSPAALHDVPPADTYLLDGDHNYATVHAELSAIGAHTQPGSQFPLVFLHDVGWPAGRRDQYYDPSALEPAVVHPHTFDRGVHVDSEGVVEGGFRGMGRFAFARVEGGPRNGVLTAIEDFLATRSDLLFVNIPCVFGLGVLYSRQAAYAEALSQTLRAFDRNPLLARLESNRIRLYLTVLGLQDQAAATEAERKELVSAIETAQRETRTLRDELANTRVALELEQQGSAYLRARLSDEEQRANEANRLLAEVFTSAAWKMVSALRSLKDAAAPPGTPHRRAYETGLNALKALWK